MECGAELSSAAIVYITFNPAPQTYAFQYDNINHERSDSEIIHFSFLTIHYAPSAHHFKETLIKASAHIAPSDFQADCTKRPQEYCRISRELSAI